MISLLGTRSLLGALILGFGLLNPAYAASQASARLEKLVETFEQNLDRAFNTGRSSLDRFREQHQRQAVNTLAAELAKAAEVDDRLWLAWHILSLETSHNAALNVFKETGKEPPIDLLGGFAPQEAPNSPPTKALVLLVHHTVAPSNEAVIAAATPAIQQYTSRNSSAVRSFIRGLASLRKQGAAQIVDPVLAYYFPGEARQSGIRIHEQSTSWISPPDRYLLDHGLLSVEVGFTPPQGGTVITNNNTVATTTDSTWNFPIPLAHWRLEVITDEGQAGTVRVSARHENVRLSWSTDGIISVGGPSQQTLEYPAGPGSHAVHLASSGNQWYLTVNGQRVGSGQGPHLAWRSLRCERQSAARSIRLRYLSASSNILAASVPGSDTLAKAQAARQATPPVAAAPQWQTDLEASLKNPVGFNFHNVALQEVVNGLNLLTPISWHLDESALALAELPMFMAGEGMTGEQLLVWFERLAGLSHRLEERGVVLFWE